MNQFVLIVLAIVALAQWPWLIFVIAGGVGLYVWAMVAQEANLSDEEKAARRERKEEYLHAQRMNQLAEAHQQNVQKRSTQNAVLTTLGKAGFGILLHTLTNGAHRHRH